jgi:hypothetical protein
MTVERLLFQEDHAAERLQTAQENVQQGGLARTVGAEDRRHRARVHRQAQPLQHQGRAALVAELQVVQGQHRGAGHQRIPVRLLVRSTRKSDAPISEVRMPNGISPGSSVRATVSLTRQ